MGTALNRDAIAGMAADAIQQVTKRNGGAQTQRAKYLASPQARYAEAERHAQALLESLNVVKELSDGRFDFQVMSNKDDSFGATDPRSVKIWLKGLGTYNRYGSAPLVEYVEPSLTVSDSGNICYNGHTKLSSVAEAISHVVRMAAEKNLFPAAVGTGHENG